MAATIHSSRLTNVGPYEWAGQLDRLGEPGLRAGMEETFVLDFLGEQKLMRLTTKAHDNGGDLLYLEFQEIGGPTMARLYNS